MMSLPSRALAPPVASDGLNSKAQGSGRLGYQAPVRPKGHERTGRIYANTS